MAFGMNAKEDRYNLYKDKSVRVNTPNSSYLGTFQKYDSEFIYLCPAIVYENLPTENGGNKMHARIERNIPVSVNYNMVESIAPLKEGYLEELALSINSVKNKKSDYFKEPDN